MKKAAELLEAGGQSEMLPFHRHFSRLDNEQLRTSRLLGPWIKLVAFAKAGLVMTALFTYVRIINEFRRSQ